MANNKIGNARARLLAAIGYAEVRPIDESAWRRGLNDTKAGVTDWRFAVADYIGSPLVALALEPAWGIAAALGGILVLWIAATALAPVKQRNEARRERARLNTELVSGVQPSDRVLVVQKLEGMIWKRILGEGSEWRQLLCS